MKKVMLAVLVAIIFPMATNAATVFYNRVTTYVDGSAIPAAKIPTIVYRAATGPSATGPWGAASLSVTDNQAIMMPDPAAGGTLFYTVRAELDNQVSGWAVPASKTMPVPVPSAPSGCSVQ